MDLAILSAVRFCIGPITVIRHTDRFQTTAPDVSDCRVCTNSVRITRIRVRGAAACAVTALRAGIGSSTRGGPAWAAITAGLFILATTDLRATDPETRGLAPTGTDASGLSSSFAWMM